jgi:hypothetical protein
VAQVEDDLAQSKASLREGEEAAARGAASRGVLEGELVNLRPLAEEARATPNETKRFNVTNSNKNHLKSTIMTRLHRQQNQSEIN